MGKLKSAAKFALDVAEKMADREAEVSKLTSELMRLTYGLEHDQARKVAQTLVARADITWK